MIASKKKDKVTKSSAKRISPARIAVWGVAGIAIAAAVAFWFSVAPADAEGQDKARKTSAIPIVDHLKVYGDSADANNSETKQAKESTEDPHKGQVLVRGKWYPEYNEKGGRIWVTKNEVRYHTPVVVTNRVDEARIRPERKIFQNKAEQEIAVLLNTPLGTTMIGKRVYGEDFEKSFLESISNPIIVMHDDDEQTAALKSAVNEAKLALKERYDNGESVAEIMNDTYRELRDLASYREDLRRETQKLIAGSMGDTEETKMIYEAANRMLAERGLKPLREPVLLKNKLKLEQGR
jgi:hypothetical protein